MATAFFAFARKPARAIIDSDSYTRRRNLWFVLTLAAFLASNFWLFVVIATPLLIHAKRREANPLALYFFILFLLPMADAQIPGIGFFSNLFVLSYTRLLALAILLPIFFQLRRSDAPAFFRTGPDKALAAYLLLSTVLFLRDANLTMGLRHAFYLFTDVFLPYFVISRSLRNLQSYRDAVLSLVLAIMLIALIAVFESTKHWLLYASVNAALDLKSGMTGYIGRDGILRAIVTAGQPIALGLLMVAGMGFYLYLQRSIQQNFSRRFGMVLLAGGLIAPLSRGPWVGAVALLVVFAVTGRNPVRRLISLSLAAMLVFTLASILPGGERVINLLPFIGSTDTANIDYRDRLLTNSMIVIQRSPWFGSTTYRDTPEMEEMRQGEGIIDIVNSYVAIALEYGFVGLGLFVGFFVLTLFGIYRAMHSISDKNSEEYLLGRALLSTLLAIMVTIFTVSSITIIPLVYWSVAGLGVAYAQMMKKNAV